MTRTDSLLFESGRHWRLLPGSTASSPADQWRGWWLLKSQNGANYEENILEQTVTRMEMISLDPSSQSAPTMFLFMYIVT